MVFCDDHFAGSEASTNVEHEGTVRRPSRCGGCERAEAEARRVAVEEVRGLSRKPIEAAVRSIAGQLPQIAAWTRSPRAKVVGSGSDPGPNGRSWQIHGIVKTPECHVRFITDLSARDVPAPCAVYHDGQIWLASAVSGPAFWDRSVFGRAKPVFGVGDRARQDRSPCGVKLIRPDPEAVVERLLPTATEYYLAHGALPDFTADLQRSSKDDGARYKKSKP